MLKTFVIIVLVLAAVYATVVAYGAFRWEAGTRHIRDGLNAGRISLNPRVVDFRELDGLPAPVQRYFRIGLKEGQPMVAGVQVQHTGTFNMGDTSDRWKPFTSDQQVITQRPGFDWDARIAMMPGLTVRVHDAYASGQGSLHGALLGWITVVDMRDSRNISEGELMRFLAEAAWYPTALLPSQGVNWTAVDAHSARATLVDGPIGITMLFGFDEQGLMDTVRAEARGRTTGDKIIPTPWQGRFWNYQERQGMHVPMEGEVAWLAAEGTKPYWRGRISDISYEFAK
jgi:hypothetical protein